MSEGHSIFHGVASQTKFVTSLGEAQSSVIHENLRYEDFLVSHLREGYCWSTSFKVLEVLFLGEVSSAFLPSKKTC
jgi:hypothetical protein